MSFSFISMAFCQWGVLVLNYRPDFVVLRTQHWTLERTLPFSQWASRMLRLPKSSQNSTFPPALNSKPIAPINNFVLLLYQLIQLYVCFDRDRDLCMQSVTPHEKWHDSKLETIGAQRIWKLDNGDDQPFLYMLCGARRSCILLYSLSLCPWN